MLEPGQVPTQKMPAVPASGAPAKTQEELELEELQREMAMEAAWACHTIVANTVWTNTWCCIHGWACFEGRVTFGGVMLCDKKAGGTVGMVGCGFGRAWWMDGLQRYSDTCSANSFILWFIAGDALEMYSYYI